MATRAQRKHLASLMNLLYAHRGQFIYEQRRPMELTKISERDLRHKLRAGEHIIADCSETVTAMCKWAGLKDPNGLRYNGLGNTETMLGHLHHYSSGRFANVGAIVHFQNPDHVGMVLKPSHFGGDPIIFEHGGPGAAILPVSLEARFHVGPVIYLSVNDL